MSYPQGVWFCDLAPVVDAQAVPFVVALRVALPHRLSGNPAESIAVGAVPSVGL